MNNLTRQRVAVVQFVHETHCFLSRRTPWSAFTVRRGGEILSLCTDSSPMGAFLRAADRHGWDVTPTVMALAEPGAMLADEVLETFWGETAGRLHEAAVSGLDAVYVILHGAAASESLDDVDGELLRRIRGVAGLETLPIYGVYDLHANFSKAMAEHADGLVAYRENPHTDAAESAMRAADLLARHLSGQPRGHQSVSFPPILLTPTVTGTSADPMRSLEATARKLERTSNGILAVNINAGYAFADAPHVGLSFSIVAAGHSAEALAQVEAAMAELNRVASEHHRAAISADEPLCDVVNQVRTLAKNRSENGLTVLVEPSDNIGGGGPGDGVTLLRMMMDEGLENAGFCLWDPAAVETLRSQRPGDVVTLELGGRGSECYDGPVTADCTLVLCKDGLFELEDKQSHLAAACGDRFNMGPCSVVRTHGEHGGDVTILITTVATPTMDLGQWRHLRIDPEAFSWLVVKAAVAHRRAIDPIAARQIWVDTPGPCSSDVSRCNYKNLRRPIYPIDAMPGSQPASPLPTSKLSVSQNH